MRRRVVRAARRRAACCVGRLERLYLAGLFERMGIAAEVKRKAVFVPGGLTAARLVRMPGRGLEAP